MSDAPLPGWPLGSCVQGRSPAMFDAKSVLDALMRGGAPTQGQAQAPQGGLGALQDLLGQLLAGGVSPQQRNAPLETPRSSAYERAGSRPQGGGSLEDLLGSVLGGRAGSPSEVQAKLQRQGGGLADILGQVLGQATSGVREGA